MPDLYVVMSDEELVEALEEAKNNGATSCDIIEHIQYQLIFNDCDALNLCHKEYGKWFPNFSYYLNLPTKDDKIGVLLSSTIWSDFDLDKVYNTLNEQGIKINNIKDKWFDSKQVEEFNQEEKEVSKVSPVNSPWTARNEAVVASALENIEGINYAKIIEEANVEIRIFTYLVNGSPIPNINPIVNFSYPNVLHLYTDSGEYNVFMGENIDLAKIKEMFNNNSITYESNKYDEYTDGNLLLYTARDRKIIR